MALLAGACGQGNDPSSWTEAQQDSEPGDSDLAQNFLKACSDGNSGGDVEFSDSQTAVYCNCTFRTVVEYYGGVMDGDGRLSDAAEPRVDRDFQAFRDLESSLRDDPQQVPADLESLFGACENQALGP